MTGPRWLTAPEAAVPRGDGWLSAAERAVQAKLRFAPRRESWRRGRWTAKLALSRALGVDAGPRVTILAAEDGAPEPYLDGERLPLALSISHREALAAAALSEAGVGVDLEAIEPRGASLLETFFTARERALVAAAEAPDLVANIVWSAKESALKRLRVGLRRDTRGVQVSLREERAEGWTRLEVEDLELARTYRGWWRREGELVLTLVADELGPPVRL